MPVATRVGLARWAERAGLWCLAGLLVTLPFWRHRVLLHRPLTPIFFEFQDITLYTNDLLWIAALGAWLLCQLLEPAAPGLPALACTCAAGTGGPQAQVTGRAGGRLRLGPWFLIGPLALLTILGLVGLPFALDPVFAAYRTLRMLLLIALYLMALNLRLERGSVAWPLAAGVVLQAALALPQFILRRSLGLTRLGEVTVQAAWPGASVVMVGEERWLRAYGLAQHPNLLGGLLMAALLILAGYYLAQSGGRRLPLLLIFAIGLTGLLLTFSRSAWLGTIAGSLVMAGLLLLHRRRMDRPPTWPSVALLLAVLLLVTTLFAAINWPLLRPRLGLAAQGVEVRSVDARLMQIEAAWALIQMRPLMGIGLGNFPIALYLLTPETVADYPIYQPVHNILLLVIAELGFPGGVAWLCLIGSPWLALLFGERGGARNRSPRLRFTPWGIGLTGALAALVIVSFLDSYLWSSHQGRLLLILVLGLWAREWMRRPGEPGRPETL